MSRRLLLNAAIIGSMASPGAARLRLGVQGHCNGAGGQTPYRAGDLGPGVSTQLDDVRALGSDSGPTFYRNGLSCAGEANGTVDAQCIATYARFVEAAQRAQVTVLPILFPPIDRDPHPFPDPATTAGSDALFAVTAVAELYAFQVAASLAAVGVKTFELSNELDNHCIHLDAKGNAPNGNLPTMFNDTKFAYFAAILRGLNAGVKRASPAAKTIINSGGWLHWGWYAKLVTQLELPFDIIGYHWYSEMGDINCSSPSGGNADVMAELTQFNKSIWITEMNRRGGSSSGTPQSPDSSGEAAEAAWLTHELTVMSELSERVPLFRDGVVVIYQLYDQPGIGATPNLTCSQGRTGESCFGLREVACHNDGLHCSGFAVGRRKAAWSAVHTWAQMQMQTQIT